MKKVGILGGTFDPPHVGHLIIANEVLHSLSLDEIWFMPNQEPPHKQKTTCITNQNRLDMLDIAISNHPYFKIQTIEMEREGRSYTYDTMKILTERFPKIEFYFIIGADMIEYLPKWYKIQELMELVHFVGVNRPLYNHETKNYSITYVEVPEINISSNNIRDRLKEGQSIRYLVPDSVKSYIEENQLYGT
ncbi:nicotinate-nucleotide adenylyltransferase [Bacillus sp. 03113]|uniref:nicotinate-nucleotide adenylyltransferase n=1 Tax=Bacillus sp. 03113 TaxID=2578211 RepID=UPI00114473DC|nr:nicotinate-nucleotide adenylyltransferase [Bacillus sp. 03113]